MRLNLLNFGGKSRLGYGYVDLSDPHGAVLSRISCKRFSALFKVFGLPPSVIAGAKQEHGSVWLGLLPPFLVRERMPDLVSGHLIGLYVGW